MRRESDRRIIKTKVLKICSAFAALVVAFMFCLTNLYPNIVRADSEIIISAVPKSTDVGPGDIIIINIVANRFPNITEFGPIEFNYDADKAEFVSFEQGKELSNYVFTETQSNGTLTVNGTDQKINTTTEGSGEDEASLASFSSDEQVILFSIAIRLSTSSYGEINCWLSSVGSFISPTENVTASIGSGITIPIRSSGLSSNATIASLKVKGTSIAPDFNPNITEYTCSVERSVREVQVTVIPTNLWAAINIKGNQQLEIGDNIVTVDVTAQDGISQMHYTIHVVVKESNIPENASLVDFAGATYTFMDFPEDISVPEGFILTTRTINGYSVPVYAKDGVSSVLLYLFDGSQAPGFYFYNSAAKTVIKYEPEITLIESSKVLMVTAVPSDIVIPDEFKPAVLNTETMSLTGYTNEQDFICYLSDENGHGDFYRVDQTDGSIDVYRFADKKAELLYSYLFDVFLVIAIIEAVIITITVYIIRRLVSDRTNPRPKRV